MKRQPKPRGTEAKLAQLKSLRARLPAAAAVEELRKFLGDSSNLVVAEAADILAAANVSQAAPDLVAAFERFMIDPEETDKVCRAKNAIVEALHKMDYSQPEVFVRGIRHVQKEPAWPKAVDTSINLRANSAFALVRIGYPDLLILLVDLLLDEERAARAAAAQALGASGRVAAVPLLRLKARIGDKEPDVTAECLTALIRLAPDESLPFVAEFLRGGSEAVQEGAAFALAESRRPEAFPFLRDALPHVYSRELKEVLLLAMSMLRLPAAIDFLVGLVTGEDQAVGLAALSALAIHRHNERIKDRIAEAVKKTANSALAARYEEKYAAKD